LDVENGGLFVSRGSGRHPDRVLASYEIMLVVRGELRLREPDAGYEVSPGGYLILVPGVRHWAEEDFPPDLEFFWLHFRLLPGKSKAGRGEGLAIPRTGRASDPDRLSELFRWFLDAQEKGKLDKRLANVLCVTMLVLLASEPGREDDERIPLIARQARRILLKSFLEDISTGGLAGRLGCNQDYLGRVYRQSFGASVMSDMHSMRVRLAKRLLLDERLNVNQVSVQCGYSDATYFRRMFKRFEGVSPRAYREMYSYTHINRV
jgi:AraC-like DNA-binding protein